MLADIQLLEKRNEKLLKLTKVGNPSDLSQQKVITELIETLSNENEICIDNYSESEKKILKYYKNFYRSIGDEKDMDYLKENNIFKKIIELSDFKELKIDTLDLSDVFINYEDACFHSLVHCNDKGYEIIAKKIFDFIKKT